MQLKKEKVCLDTKKAIILIVWLSLGQVIFQYLMQKSSSVSSYLLYIISPQILIMNFIPIFLIMILLYFITNRVSLSFAIFSVFFQVLLIINHYKIYFRDEPLKPTDFVLGRETATMLNTYKLPFSFKIVLLTLLLIFVIIYLFKYVKNNKTKIVVRLTGIVSTLIVMFLSYTFVYSSEIIYQEISWVPNEYYETFVTNCKGFTYSFINSFSKLDYKKPESYDINKVKEILSSYETEKNEEVVPNVIAVMSEAFFDPQTSENLEFHTGKNPLLHYNKKGQLLWKYNSSWLCRCNCTYRV